MKSKPEDLFFVPSAMGPMQMYSINVPVKTNHLVDDYGSFFAINDDSFLNIATNLRSYLYSVRTGSLWKTVAQIDKPILVNNDGLVSGISESYIASMQAKYPALCQDADNASIEQAILEKSDEVYYIYQGSLYSPQDGSRVVKE